MAIGLEWGWKSLTNLFGGWNDVDERMTADKALTFPPVWYAVNRICGNLSQLPFDYMKRLERGAEKAHSHPNYYLFKTRPNEYQTPMIFLEQVTCHALLWGNGRAYIHRTGNYATELIPLMPDRTVSFLYEGEKWHATRIDKHDRFTKLESSAKGKEDYATVFLRDEDVLHIPGLGFDGVVGKSLLDVAAQSWSIGLGGQKYNSNQIKKGFAGKIMLEGPPGLAWLRDEAKAQEFLEAFKKQHGSDQNAEVIGLLREGVKANVIAMPNDQAQWVEQMKHQRQDAALWFLLESILGDDSSQSYNTLEQKNLAYLINCLQRWLTKWEQECNWKLRSEREKRDDSFFFKFNVGPLLRMDTAATVTTLGNAIVHRIMNPNEARDKLDLNPYDGGDEFANPAISPGKPGEEPKKETKKDDKAKSAIVSRMAHLIGVEMNRVKQASHSAKNFVDWVEGFYSKWEAKLSSTVLELGSFDASSAVYHCMMSKAAILEAAGKATAETLSAEIESMVKDWPARAVIIADVIQGDLDV